jgi:fused signal recognition particle receptor
VLKDLKERFKRQELSSPEQVKDRLKQILFEILSGRSSQLSIATSPAVILVVGVNGTGKTTSIGKLAHRLQGEGKKVMLAAGDTFRAAASEQLSIWGERAGIPVIKHREGADPGAVVFDAVTAAKAREIDVLIVDTAGRLHTKSNLMEELKKVKRILSRELPGAPQETLLVLDGSTGQNALVQAKMFNEAVGVSGIVLTKLDGTSKGGIVFAINKELAIPVKFVGIGEARDDLRSFDPKEFVDALL